MTPTTTRQWILAEQPMDMPDEKTFKLVEAPLPELKEDQVLAKVLYLSNDPAQRGWIQKGINPERLYVPPVELNAPMSARGIAEVIESKSSKFPKGSLVVSGVNWVEYCVLDAATCTPVQKVGDLSETHFLGALGLTGLTAYYGLQIVRAGAEDTVVVSGAAGATGSMVVQIAKKMFGCKKVIGIAGTDDKCRWVESLGADLCINYKSPTFRKDLREATKGYVEVYFDNVGGKILDLMLTRMATYGRVAACGAISGYNNHTDVYGLKCWSEIITNRIEIRGFIVLDAGAKIPSMIGELAQAYKEGKLQLGAESETVVPTAFDSIPKTWMKLFAGENTGKLVTKIE
ncbi:hypothetical protein AAFC00_006272 [Neodothiora populina]|uniref:Enoyl reductase (ER) domain-containing protein n=1 Tax=Neodothiora populina TaxID=2781224 RepID=A0ABR3P4N1_9PEZI